MKSAYVAVGDRELDARRRGNARRRLLDPRAHERIGELRPGDADLELLERLERRRLEPGREHAEQLLAAGDVARHRPAVSKLAASGQQPSSETSP